MVASPIKMRAIMVVGIAMAACAAGSVPVGFGGGEKSKEEKANGNTFEERHAKVVAGILKLKESEVIALLGPPTKMNRPVTPMPGRLQADRELVWDLATRITVRYKEDKVSEVTGVFSEHLPVERVSPDHFRRVQVGLTHKQVVEILGDSYATFDYGDGVQEQWGAASIITIHIDKDGLMVGRERKGNSYGPRGK